MILALLLMVAMPMMAERVSPETARKVATTFLNNNGAKSAQLTDLSKAAGFANLYIFNAEQGFVVMAADDCVRPILGYSLTGKFVAEGMPENVRGWLQGYSDEIQYAVDSKAEPSAEIRHQWKNLSAGNAKAAKATVVVAPLIQTTWDQDPGYNEFCPYDQNAGELTVTGCVATAIAQIMRYWEYPSHGASSHSYTPSTHPEYGLLSVNFANATYDWTDMPLYNANTEIAKLMYHCGVAVDMDYDIGSNGGSGAYNTSIAPALKSYFNYKSTAELKFKSNFNNTNWLDLLKTELNASRPIQYNGSGSGGGHAFVCDGYDSNNYFHFNWGWSGNCDAFYTVNNLNPGPGGTGSGDYGVYNDNQSIVIGIEPKDCTASTPTSFNVTTEDRNALLTWNAASNAVSYFIYRNGLLVANTTNITYTDSDLAYGTYAYYVKSVDSNGAKSSPTATITISIEPTASSLTVTKNGNQAILNWTEPEWVTPQTDDEVLTYSYGNTLYTFGSGGTMKLYYGHKYPAALINANKVLYKVSFYPTMTGSFRLCVYTANAGNSKPQTQVYTQDITVSVTGWNDIVISTPLQLNASKDLWVFIYDPEGKTYPMGAGSFEGTDSNGNYVSTSTPTSSVSVQEVVMLINTYITDGAFTYNLYDGTTTIASNISSSTYTVNNIANNTAHQYTLKTNFNGGLTESSNMAGLTLGTASLSNLQMAASDQMTITEGSKLTVSGTLTNTNPANLILENGAELVHNSASVKATVKKTVTPPSADDYGWYFIASPVTETVTPTAENGFLNGAYDLYYYNEPTYYWMNYEYSPFDINHQKGYLYANETTDGTTLQFAGTLTPSNNSVTINNLSHSASSLNGFNLVGNPFACNATVGEDFYVVNNTTGKVILASNTAEIAPCAGIFVKATENDASVTFTKATSSVEPSSSSFDIVVKRAAQPTKDGVPTGSTTLDRARVHLSDAEPLEKFNIGDGEGSVIYFPQNGQDLAVACANGQNEMPLNFKAAKNGTYTLAFEVENLDLDYLHMIDNMTGEEVDVLAMPTYTFEAKTSDYASRFRLVFAENETEGASTGSAAFAYITDGEIIINVADACDASLQVVDMMGRVVLAGDAMNRVSTNGMTAGVYVLRLINGEQVKTQKIVVR